MVVSTFMAYAIHDRLTGSEAATANNPSLTSNKNVSNQGSQLSSSNVSNSRPAPTISAPSNSGLRDGQYVGDVTDAYYGNVQVEAIIQGGRITNVQFLDFPQDRRTSQRINSYAVPVLQNEAIQSQNAYVDIISGATLTSEAFVQSLQSALNRAKG